MIYSELKKRILSSIFIIPITFFFIFKGSFLFILFLGVFFLISSYEWVNFNKKIIIKYIGIIYLFLSSYTAFMLRDTFSLEIFLLIILICISTDLGGYFFGKILKGPRLTKISPKKTYSGVIGSFSFAIFFSLLYNNLVLFDINSIIILPLSNDNNSDYKTLFILFVLIISLISQLGDLLISYFKRLAKVKDTGRLIPGHGGLLDRVDGIIFAIPFTYLLLIYLN